MNYRLFGSETAASVWAKLDDRIALDLKGSFVTSDTSGKHDSSPIVVKSFQDALLQGEMLAKMFEVLKNKIDQSRNNGRRIRIHIAGHSVGAAYATLASVGIRIKNPSVAIRIATFGSPKVGDQNFVTFYQNLQLHHVTARFISFEDVVVRSPLDLQAMKTGLTEVIGETSFIPNDAFHVRPKFHISMFKYSQINLALSKRLIFAQKVKNNSNCITVC